MFISTLIITAIMIANCPSNNNFLSVEPAIDMAQGVVVRHNAHLKCNAAGAELYLYTNGSFKIISSGESLSGSYTIEDGENLVLNANGYRKTYGKIYFRGAEVSKVILGERTYYPV